MQAKSSLKPDAVFDALEKRIAGGRWKVGERIPTEVELAAEFDCSRTTVAKAVSRLVHAGLVERRTRAGTRVLSATPSSAARPARPTLEACAFIYSSERHEGIWRTVCGFQEAAFGMERRTLMLPTGADFRKGAEIVGRLDEFDVKGAVLFPTIQNEKDHDYYVRMIHASRFPIVLVELNLPGVVRPSVVPDGFHAGYTVTRHLLKRGLKKIGFLANFAWAPVTRDKYLGYRQAMEEAGLDGESLRVHLENRMTPRFDDPLREPTEVAAAYLDAQRAARTDVKAVVCGNDFLALGLIAAARGRKLRVPEDLKVAGIDDFRLAAEAGVTTYRIPYEEMG
ncbi:MAG TPA: GntR family transcriptional regulator, partial [Candidatus Methylacidiphilales bacterium]